MDSLTPDSSKARGSRARGGRAIRHRRRVLFGIVAMFSALGMVAAGCSSDAATENDEPITIGYVDWAEDVALTDLFQQQLEDSGYKVELKQFDDVGKVFSGMADGDIDLFLDTWLPVTHKKYWDQYGDKLEDLGVWYDNARLALTVPSYVQDVNSIADLKDHADEFGGTIVGIDAAAGIMNRVESFAIPDYGLAGAMKVQPSSESQMLADLGEAIADRKPIVVTLWHPHWAYSAYDLKDLQDPRQAMGETENLHITARGGFTNDHPNLAQAASNFTIDDAHLQSLEKAVHSAGEGQEADAVRQWREENMQFVKDKFGTLHESGQRYIR